MEVFRLIAKETLKSSFLTTKAQSKKAKNYRLLGQRQEGTYLRQFADAGRSGKIDGLSLVDVLDCDMVQRKDQPYAKYSSDGVGVEITDGLHSAFPIEVKGRFAKSSFNAATRIANDIADETGQEEAVMDGDVLFMPLLI